MSVEDFLERITGDSYLNGALVHHRDLDATRVVTAEFPDTIHPHIRYALNRLGIAKLYSHQEQAFNLVTAGHNVVIVTPTASGKSLSYNLPVLNDFLNDPSGHALYIFPLKALEQDQYGKLRQLIKAAYRSDSKETMSVVSVGVYDGDTPSGQRTKMRKSPPNILITNPDMLHLSIMSYHANWEDLLRNLKYVVIDELHVYRGVFGSHILHVLRRLNRICNYYGISPRYLASSATIAGAGELAENLSGKPFKLVEESGAPQTRRHFLFFNPVDSYLTFALRLMVTALSKGLKVIVFTKARRTTELLHQWLNEANPGLSAKVSSYRAGFLPEERREIEKKLISGKLQGVISTSALELGIDIGGLDVCIMVGYPGTVATTWQRGGRVGRGELPAAICLVAGQDQLDQYFMRNPGDFFARSVEKAVVDSTNEHIARNHIICAAQEVPLNPDDEYVRNEKHLKLVEELVNEGELLIGASGDRWFSARRRPQRRVDVRASGESYSIELEGNKRQLGIVSGRAVFAECHPGAVYLHRARQYIVTRLDSKAKRVIVKLLHAKYYTTPLFEKDTEIIEEYKSRELAAGKVSLVKLKVTEQLVGYQKRRTHTQEMISQHELEYPPSSYETIGLALSIPDGAATISARQELHFRGGIHGVEHSLLALAPLYAICDRNDMGGYSTTAHPQVGGPTVFMYDGHPGGIGLSARIFEIFPELVEKTWLLVSRCECETGCPSCIHSPKCGHGNIPLDKQSAVLTLEILSGKRGLEEPSESRPLNIDISKSSTGENNMNIKMNLNEEISNPDVPEIWPVNLSGVVFDIETQRSADEVGGWGNIRAMGLACAVAYRFPQNEYLYFDEKQVEELIELLKNADLVIGFNHIRFDYEVLRGYSGYDFRKINDYDIMLEVQKILKHRLSLNALASATLGASKSADGLQSLQWWREGKVDKVVSYCRQDVAVTRDLFYYILENEYLLFEKKNIGLVRVPLKRERIDVKFE